MIKRLKILIDFLRCRKLFVQRPNYDHGEFKPFGLVDGHHLGMALWKGLIRVFVLIDATREKKPQEAVEEMEAKEFAVLVRTIVCRQPNDPTIGEAQREFQNVANGGSAETVEALILVSNYAEISASLGHLNQKLFLDVVRILVFVNQNVSDVSNYTFRDLSILEEIHTNF
jgi:hypothetical protein